METTDIATHRQFYDDYWTTHEQRLNVHETVRLAEILLAVARVMEITGKRTMRICDLGSGRGWLANELSKFGPVVAVDLSPVAIEKAKQAWPHVDFRAADVTTWRPAETFDLVVSSEVLEHVPDQAGMAKTIRYLLRDGGHLILTMPNRKLKGTWDRGEHGKQLVEQWLTPKELRSLLSASRPILQKTFIFDFAYTGIHRFLSAPKLLRLLAASGLLPLYDVCRNAVDLGLYQLYIGQYLASKEEAIG